MRLCSLRWWRRRRRCASGREGTRKRGRGERGRLCVSGFLLPALLLSALLWPTLARVPADGRASRPGRKDWLAPTAEVAAEAAEATNSVVASEKQSTFGAWPLREQPTGRLGEAEITLSLSLSLVRSLTLRLAFGPQNEVICFKKKSQGLSASRALRPSRLLEAPFFWEAAKPRRKVEGAKITLLAGGGTRASSLLAIGRLRDDSLSSAAAAATADKAPRPTGILFGQLRRWRLRRRQCHAPLRWLSSGSAFVAAADWPLANWQLARPAKLQQQPADQPE